MNEELLKSLNGAIDAAIKELVTIDQLSKGDVSLQDAKLRPETANGTLPGDNREESILKPEDAKKAEDAAAKGENPFANKDDDKDDKKKKKDKGGDDDEDDDDDLDDDKADKMKAKIKKYEDDKAAKASGKDPSVMSKSDMQAATDALQKSIVTQVSEVMQKSFGDRLGQLEAMIQKLVTAPQPRQSVSGLAPLAKSADDVQPAGATAAPQLTKASALDQLFSMQKADDKRVDSSVIARVEMNDFSVLQERGINLK